MRWPRYLTRHCERKGARDCAILAALDKLCDSPAIVQSLDCKARIQALSAISKLYYDLARGKFQHAGIRSRLRRIRWPSLRVGAGELLRVGYGFLFPRVKRFFFERLNRPSKRTP